MRGKFKTTIIGKLLVLFVLAVPSFFFWILIGVSIIERNGTI